MFSRFISRICNYGKSLLAKDVSPRIEIKPSRLEKAIFDNSILYDELSISSDTDRIHKALMSIKEGKTIIENKDKKYFYLSLRQKFHTIQTAYGPKISEEQLFSSLYRRLDMPLQKKLNYERVKEGYSLGKISLAEISLYVAFEYREAAETLVLRHINCEKEQNDFALQA